MWFFIKLSFRRIFLASTHLPKTAKYMNMQIDIGRVCEYNIIYLHVWGRPVAGSIN